MNSQVWGWTMNKWAKAKSLQNNENTVIKSRAIIFTCFRGPRNWKVVDLRYSQTRGPFRPHEHCIDYTKRGTWRISRIELAGLDMISGIKWRLSIFDIKSKPLSHIQTILSRQLWNHILSTNMEISSNEDITRVENIQQKGKFLIMSKFSFCHNVFKSCRL